MKAGVSPSYFSRLPLLLALGLTVCCFHGMSPARADDYGIGLGDSTILVFDDVQEQVKAGKAFGDLWKSETGGGKPAPDLSFSWTRMLSGTYDIRVTPLSPEEIAHDIDKVYGDRYLPDSPEPGATSQWKRVHMGTKVLLPAVFKIPNLVGPVGFNIGAEIGWARAHELTIKTDRPILPDTGEARKFWRETLGTLHYKGEVHFPHDPELLYQSYKPGSELKETGEQYILGTIGVNVGVLPVRAEATFHALYEGIFTRVIRFPYSEGHKLIRFSVENATRTGSTKEVSVGLGVTVLYGRLGTGNLQINPLSFRVSHARTGMVGFDFTYDLTYPQAREALARALQGDLRASQELAISRDDESAYQGVILNEQKSSFVDQSMRNLFAGLGCTNDEFLRTTGRDTLKKMGLDGFVNGFLFSALQSGHTESESRERGFYEEHSVVRNFDYHKEFETNLLWGLIKRKHKSVDAKSSVVQASHVVSGVGLRETFVNRVSFSYVLNERSLVNEAAADFFETTADMLRWKNPRLAEAAQALHQHEACRNKHVTVRYDGTFYDSAIARILAFSEQELRGVFDKTAAMRDHDGFRDSRHARSRLRDFKKKFFPKWREAKTLVETDGGLSEASQAVRERVAQAFRDMLQSYGDDVFGFEFLTILATQAEMSGAGEDARSESASEPEFFTKFSVSGNKCDYSWSQSGGESRHQFLELVKDWAVN